MHRIRFPRRLLVLLALPGLTGCVALPRLDEALEAADRVAQTTKVFAADGTLITELHAEINRELVPLSEVPIHVRDAVLAIEDARFYRHSGVDYLAIVRALTRNAREGRIVEGGSTITQQLVKNTLAGNERTYERKVREALLAFQFEQRFTKDEILERYLNTVYFGRGAYGVQAAAGTYFSKPARRLTLPEGALLAGLIRSPSRYDPSDPKIGRSRRAVVLRRMFDEGMLTPKELRRARGAPIGLRPRRETERYRFPYFVDYVKDLIFDGGKAFAALGRTHEERVNAVFKGGLRIYTTIDPHLQRTAERAVRTALPYGSDPYAAFVAVRPRSGAVVAMVGGRDFFNEDDPYAKFNLAVRSRRQPGSAFKPFTLVAALENGIPLTRGYRGGSRISLTTPTGEVWNVSNYGGRNLGGYMTLKTATALSVNVVYAQVVLDVGAEKVVDAAKRMGIRSKLEPYPSIALGAFEVSPLEMARAYATLANGGLRITPQPITKITDAVGNVLYEARQEPKPVLSPTVTALATEALQEVMQTGTGRGRQIGRPAAGKTGTSEEYHDAWFAGYTPEMVGVSWLGFPRAQIPMRPPVTRITVFGGSWPGQIWQQFMLEAHEGLAVEEFPVADELLVRIEVDTSRDCLPNRFTPPYLIREKTYIEGSEPTKVCTEPTTGEIPATPDVIGRSSSEARDILLKAGFDVVSAARACAAFPAGAVCDQEPAPGDPSTVGTRATIYVSSGSPPAAVPAVIGRTASRAAEKLAAAGYRVRRRESSANDVPCADPGEERPQRVRGQWPCPGAALARGGTVTIYVNG